MPVSKHEFKLALAQFPAGVTVVTMQSGESLLGITVTAFSSLSLEPPLVLICIDHGAGIHDHLAPGRHFAVNLLAADQEVLSNAFASKSPDRFAGVQHSPGPHGSPLLAGAVMAIECQVMERLPGGDHTIVVGQIEFTQVDEQREPLLYARGKYQRLA